MKRRKWNAKTNATIVLERLKGKLVAYLGDHRQAERVCRTAYPLPESRVSVLGLSAHLGSSAVCRRTVNQQETRAAADAATRSVSAGQSPAESDADAGKPRPTAPQQWWDIDMIKVMVEPIGWVDVMIVRDWYTKKIVGHDAGLQAKSTHWRLALEQAVQRQFQAGVQGQGLSLMSENGCQPTSVAFMKTCATLGITQAFTSYTNSKGNAETERLMRTLKEKLL